MALLYGYAGTVRLSGIADAASANAGDETLLLTGTALLAVGLLFKVSAAPFHSWTPDVYQGAPTPITGFMAACTKVAAFGALLRVFYVGARRAGLGVAARALGRGDPHHAGRLGGRAHPDRTSSGCSPTPRSRSQSWQCGTSKLNHLPLMQTAGWLTRGNDLSASGG